MTEDRAEPGAPVSAPHPAGRHERARDELGRQLEILALCGFAFVQPVLDVFGRSPETFLAAGADRADVVWFALGVALVPALVLGALSALGGLAGERWRRRVHRAVVGGLVGLVALRVVVDLTSWRTVGPLVLAGLVGILAAVAHRQWSGVGRYLRVASFAPAAFVVVFLAFSPTGALLAGERAGASIERITAESPSVVLVLVDELPTTTVMDGAGGIDADLFPNLARLADDATWYRNATTVGPWTSAAIPALLTGKLGPRDAPPVASAFPDNLFSLLGGVYDLNVHEPLTRMCSASLCDERETEGSPLRELFSEASRVWRDTVDPPPLEDVFVLDAGLDPRRVERIDDFVRSIAPASERPRLDYLHLMLPHVPHELTPDGQLYDAPRFPPGLMLTNWAFEPHVTDHARQGHLLQAMFTDRAIGRILDRLQATDRYDDSLVIVTADHGISFRPRDRIRGVTEGNFHDIAWVPLIVKQPGQAEPAVVDDNVELVDIVPTIAQHAGVEVPWAVEGVPLDRAGARDPVDKRIQAWSINELEPERGDVVALDGVEGFRRVLASGPLVPRSDEPDPLRAWRVGPYAELIGTRVADRAATSPSGLTGTFETGGGREVPEDAPLPLFTSGTVAGSVPADRADAGVAVVIDGVVAATSPLVTTDRPDLHRFWTLVPDALVGAGTREVTLHLVEGPLDAPVFREILVE